MAERREPAYLARPGAPPPGTPLCQADEIAEPGAKGFVFGSGAARFEMFIVRRKGRFYGYVNVCPHQFTPLDTFPEQFLSSARDRIICSTHGAEFRIEDGFCISGPCEGRALQPVPLRLAAGTLYIAETEAQG